jgi:formylglycine-generating enzyme required for sulfatase activity
MEDYVIFRHEVGLKEPNELGLYDMSGNVQEWCWDVFELTYYRESPDTDPTGPDSGNLKVLRGGSFYDTEMAEYRSAARASNNMSRRLPYTGFRLVRTAE